MISPRNLNKSSIATSRMGSKTCRGRCGEARWLLIYLCLNLLKQCICVFSISLRINFKGWADKKNIALMVEVMVEKQGFG